MTKEEILRQLYGYDSFRPGQEELIDAVLKGRDVFGKEAEDECRSLAVNRANDVRWVEHNGRTVEIPAESAVWLDDAPAGK